MDEGGDHTEPGEHELQGLLDQAGLEQHRVQKSVIAKHDDPRIGAHHLAEEQRRDRDHQDRRFERNVSGMHQGIRERISDDEGEECREEADPNRIEEDPRIERLHERREVFEREAAWLERARHIGAQAVLHHGGQRGHEAERAQRGRRHQDAQERPGGHRASPG
jgi:hypothetical protein